MNRFAGHVVEANYTIVGKWRFAFIWVLGWWGENLNRVPFEARRSWEWAPGTDMVSLLSTRSWSGTYGKCLEDCTFGLTWSTQLVSQHGRVSSTCGDETTSKWTKRKGDFFEAWTHPALCLMCRYNIWSRPYFQRQIWGRSVSKWLSTAVQSEGTSFKEPGCFIVLALILQACILECLVCNGLPPGHYGRKQNLSWRPGWPIWKVK